MPRTYNGDTLYDGREWIDANGTSSSPVGQQSDNINYLQFGRAARDLSLDIDTHYSVSVDVLVSVTTCLRPTPTFVVNRTSADWQRIL